MERYLPTGNEMISLPKLNEQTAAIEDLTFLSMQQRGMIELCGTENEPLMQPLSRSIRKNWRLQVCNGRGNTSGFRPVIRKPNRPRSNSPY